MKQKEPPGLPSLHDSRLNRKRQLVTGKVNVGGLPPKVFLWGLSVLIVGGFLYFWNAQAELDDQRQAILTKQRATAKLLGPKLIPMRDSIEEGVTELAQSEKWFVSPEVDWKELFSSPGVYMRVRLEAAKEIESLREAGAESLRDGFTSCLIVDPKAKLPTSGKPCKRSKECESGEFCNLYDYCQRPSSPFNMRMLYRALQVLSDEWVDDVREAGTDYALIGLDRSLDSITEVDLPIAIDVYQRAKYAIVVLDEDPKKGLPKPLPETFESKAERVQRVPHFARIGVWQLPSGKALARVRARAEGALRDVGTRKAPAGRESQAARARQVNSCALALDFRQKVTPPPAPETEAELGEDAEGEPAEDQ